MGYGWFSVALVTRAPLSTLSKFQPDHGHHESLPPLTEGEDRGEPVSRDSYCPIHCRIVRQFTPRRPAIALFDRSAFQLAARDPAAECPNKVKPPCCTPLQLQAHTARETATWRPMHRHTHAPSSKRFLTAPSSANVPADTENIVARPVNLVLPPVASVSSCEASHV